MARTPKETPMTETNTSDTSTAPAKAKRKPQGPRKPSPIYAFATVKDANGTSIAGAKVELAFTTRNPHKMAEYFPQATQNGESFLILTPEA